MADGDPYPQKIPRPATARPGRPAPWPTGLVDPAVFSEAELLTALERVGQIGPPPVGVTKSISPRFGELDAAMLDEISSTSAVLIALFEEAGTLRVILTRRAGHLRAHRGEVSFPGGRIEAGEGIVEAAGREAFEEVGLDPTSITVLGHLSPMITFASGSLISPVIGLLPGRPALEANPDEVERVFDVALCDLTKAGVFHEERWSHADHPAPGSEDGSFPIWFFGVEGEMVWGATARMLYELLHLFLDLELSFHD